MAHSAGCKCRECYGLAEYMHDQGQPIAGLEPAPGHETVILNLVTMGQRHDPRTCSRMACPEAVCIEANARRQAQGRGNADPFRRVRRAA